MKKTIKSMISILLVLSMLLSTSMVVFATKEEVYLSDLRLVYANSYNEAKQVLSETKLEGYQILNCNLNTNSGFVNAMLGTTGVWLAYKTTTNVDDAITDISVMQMGGGYSEGNFKEMIKKSLEEYRAMGEIYLQAIEYFAEAYGEDNFLTIAAYRQLNFYTGLDNYDEDKLGDLIVDEELTASDLATLFLQGNSHVLKNIRALLAMGVSYNEEGLHYLQRVSLLASGTYSGYIDESLADVTADDIYISDSEDIDVLCALIAPNISTFRTMFEELSAYEDELNYEDEEFTDLELKYAEHKAIADMMRAVDYLNGQSLYDFCLNYSLDTSDYSSLYPLAEALNDGQIAMTKVMHYYDVVRYSMRESPEELIDEEISALEEQYSEKPVDVYLGVDRSMYEGTFALTSAAYRADAYTDSTSLTEVLFGNGAWVSTSLQITAGAVGVGLSVWAIVRSVKGTDAIGKAAGLAADASEALKEKGRAAAEAHVYNKIWNSLGELNEARAYCLDRGFTSDMLADGVWENLSYGDKLQALMNECYRPSFSDTHFRNITEIGNQYFDAFTKAYDDAAAEAYKAAYNAAVRNARIFTGALYVFGALSTAYSAISLYTKVYDYYHPEYEVIPEAMVDLVRTVDGDRYIKYDVVLEAKMRDGEYHAGDLNAFKGQRWNALYYTKSYEAGKPLLAEFAVSNVSNRAEADHLPVHRFGETICYDLNKYNFNSSSENVFLSIKQSENQKSAVTDVPNVVGSIFGNGVLFIAGTVGIALGAAGMMGVQVLLNKKKKGDAVEE